MTDDPTFSDFAAALRGFIRDSTRHELPPREKSFDGLVLELFRLQFAHNTAYQNFCRHRGQTPGAVKSWRDIPAMPNIAFKELELTSLPPGERPTVFHSSGTTEQRPSRHFHNAESLALYEAALLAWFQPHVLPDAAQMEMLVLTPPPEPAPNSSLVHMFGAVRKMLGAPGSCFAGRLAPDKSWELDFQQAKQSLNSAQRAARPLLVLGTAFLFVHLLDGLSAAGAAIRLPPGSRVLETGGYKGRARELPKEELHRLISEKLGVPRANIVCEYGMSELGSQAYDTVAGRGGARRFQFPPWARALVVSPETGREVADGETGLVRVFDLANIRSVLAIQTEDLAVRRGDGFELLGRAAQAELRGCSLMAA
ncbi:MAG: long-chain fatty acid--CoA ligase [Verrucomicrobia bacterium]|nr:long-chain fatty acid--CoA ligase [Verrucomicrobiota bacterium]